MIEPTKMIIINIISTFILILLLFVYKFIFPKKNLPAIFLILLISLLPAINIFREGVYESGDFTLHIYEAMSFYRNLQEHVFIPRWGGELNATFGYPVFLFAYPLPNYLIAFFHFLGFSFIISLKLFLFISFVLSGISMLLFMKEFISEKAGIVASIFYLFAPFHLVELNFRVAIGEILSLVFLPLLFLGIVKMMRQPSNKWFSLEAISLACLILSHQAVSLAFFPLLIFFMIFIYFIKKPNKQYLYYSFTAAFIGLLLGAYYWVPVIVEKRFTIDGLFPTTVSFNSFWDFIYSPWRYGLLFQGPEGELSMIIGYTQWIVIFIACYFLLTKRLVKKESHTLLFFTICFFVFFFMMQSISKPLWNILPLLKNFQFSYRLLAEEVFIVAIIAGIVSEHIKETLLIMLCLVTIIYTGLNWGNRRVISAINDMTLRNNLAKSTFEGEGNGQSAPEWLPKQSVWMYRVPTQHAEILSGPGTIKELSRTTTLHRYIIQTRQNTTIKENTIYFPGWQVVVNGKKIPINYQSKNNPGVIAFSLEKGLYDVSVKFIDTPIRVASKLVSFIALLYLFIFSLNSSLMSSLMTMVAKGLGEKTLYFSRYLTYLFGIKLRVHRK